MSVENQKRLLALLLGIATITVGLFLWRGGQLGSTAAFDDRQSISQTLKQERERLEVGLTALSDAQTYGRYRADYVEAAALDDEADELADDGFPALAASSGGEADDVRRAATFLAARGGVFGPQAILASFAEPSTEPLPFSLGEHTRALQAEVAAGIASPGALDPDRWAEEANDIRTRTRGLRWAAFLIAIAVAAYTVAQVAVRRRTRYISAAGATVLYTVVTIVTFVTVF